MLACSSASHERDAKNLNAKAESKISCKEFTRG